MELNTMTMEFEVRISFDRPWYCTESCYNAQLSAEDYEAIENSTSWEEIPEEICDRVYDSLIAEIEADLHGDGTLNDDENSADIFSIYIVHPHEDEECEDEECEDEDECDND